ncbi:V-type proton ATPase catalytic subunit A-like [Grus japonensis]|uniref:V-type proton ATPase catalytic subunit A-like n=1 Tax=Grus japonensis TaxID=30415 RepID=A0ABC9XVP0_GRUJA
MWVLLLPLGLGSALLPPGHPSPATGHGDTSEGCGLCHSPHRGRAQANGTLGASVTLGCPTAGAPVGRLLAVHWHFWGGPGGTGATICSQSRGHPRCSPPYRDRAVLPAPGGTPGVLVLRHLGDRDAGTYTCLLLGEDDCACGEVTLLLSGGAPCSPPCSGPPSHGSFGLSLSLLLLPLPLLLPPACSP